MASAPQSILQDNMKIIKKTHKGEEVVSLEEEMREALYVDGYLACPVLTPAFGVRSSCVL
jgi:hypothetical protein